MAVFINGVKVAGRGISGDSTYATAVKNGYTGSEIEFNSLLGSLATINDETEAAATRAENAATRAEAAASSLSTYPTVTEMNTAILNGMNMVDNNVWSYGPTAPSDTRLLWIDSNLTTGGLKFYTNGAWTHVPVAWN